MGDAKYRFKKKDVLGAGAFSRVYKGYRKYDDLEVAIKCIDKTVVTQKNASNILGMLRREMAILKTINHTNIVRFYDCFENDKSSFIHIVLEYCNGNDLAQLIHIKAPLAIYDIHDISSQLSQAILYLSDNDIVHRDIKPSNILLHRDNNVRIVKLADFGFAKKLASEDMSKTFCGSPMYMAPETVAGREYDKTVDLWAFGTVVYQMTTKTLPYRAKNRKELREKLSHLTIASASPPMPPAVPKSLKRFVAQLLCPDSKKRISAQDACCHDFIKEHYEPPVQTADSSMSYVMIGSSTVNVSDLLDEICRVSGNALQENTQQIAMQRLATHSISMSSMLLVLCDEFDDYGHLLCRQALETLHEAANSARDNSIAFEKNPSAQLLELSGTFRMIMAECVDKLKTCRKLEIEPWRAYMNMIETIMNRIQIWPSESWVYRRNKSIARRLADLACKECIDPAKRYAIVSLLGGPDEESQHLTSTIGGGGYNSGYNNSSYNSGARYCGSCGTAFSANTDVFCTLCGIKRGSLGKSLGKSLNTRD